MIRQPLLILPFDHRSSFSKNLFNWEGELNAKQNKQISLYKTIVYKGFLMAVKSIKNKKHFGILVDQDYGTQILQDAKKKGFTITMPVEKSGQKAFTFNYGKSFGVWIEKIKPDYVKVLVRYNPNDKEINKIQLSRLAKLNDYCKKHGHKIMFELLVPASEKDLKKVKTESNYDSKLRPIYTIKAIKEIKKAIQPELWKMEGFSKSDWKKVLQVIGKDADVIILGRGQSDKKVEKWLKDAASFNQIVGFAVGRTIFFEPLEKLKDKKITQKQAIEKIGKNYSKYIDLWRKAKKSI